MLQKEHMRFELVAFLVAVATGVLGAVAATAGAHWFGGILMAIMALALFILVIPGIAAKLPPAAQALPGALLLILGLWMMAGVGQGLSFLGLIAMVVAVGTVLMPFYLIALGGQAFHLKQHKR
ncbi:hypothetical protein [Halorhodospira halophila]|uniref:Transmembrane protein n=1 Tax=Halorhodospira halophila (strain DSM 244 / SL1) TaxID=349124 RepID=A1WTQ0_HALHL|nr:hypothetical protein [Halorhodospira halophila]ABM61062.1 hypothetical protein Hhal_0268 [Halorhodospira halophila SL1]MBK1729779.1 hypothetical protein [Halorhodospira halophila]